MVEVEKCLDNVYELGSYEARHPHKVLCTRFSNNAEFENDSGQIMTITFRDLVVSFDDVTGSKFFTVIFVPFS